MGKRSRRERRERQAQRAIAAHDPAAIRALADRSPELAAQQLTAALGAMAPEDAGSAVVESAVALAGRLRRSGQLRAARRLAAAGAGRSARLRVEQALAAFALGDDAEAAQLASGDPEVQAVVGPLVEAARGVAPDPVRIAPRAGLRALHAAAAAVAAAVRGELASGRALLKRVAPGQRKAVLAAEIRAAIDVQDGSAGRPLSAALPLLAGSSALRAVAGAHEALVLAASETNADLALDLGRRLQLDDRALQLARARAAARALAVQAPPARASGAGERAALGVAQRFGADVFDENDRATACLYEGFACLTAEPERAARAFDRAIGLGGDLIEALRGKLKLAVLQAGAVCAECGVRHGDRGAEAAATADHLARALSRAPAAAPLAAAAALIAAEAWGAEGDLKAARASLAVGRAKASGALARDADLIEARLLAEAQPERALELIDKVLADRPEDVDAWRLKIALAERRGGREGADAAIVQAAEATRDPALAAEAREARGRRMDLAPFAELAPSAATAGALAAELRRAARAARSQVGAIEPRAAALREALDPAAQLAFDAACVSLAADLDGSAAGRARLVEAVRAWWSSPPALMKLAAASWLLGVADALVEAAQQARGGAGAAGALAALAEAALAAGDVPVAERLIALGAAAWPHSELARLRGLLAALRRRERRPSRRGLGWLDVLDEPLPGLKAPRPDAAAEELDAQLAPEFSLLEEAEGAPGASADGGDDDLREASALLGLLSFLGIPPGALDRLTADERRSIEARARKILEAGPSARSARELEQLIERLLGDAEIPFPSGPSRGRPRRSA
ncbi:hypothetical protein [Sorangium sp. So ce131]|uniref:hypothetical protein n=1 Tax=Sorangium sp. So ce131 TaxID=3133282 RepID=UPI003F607328